MGKYRFNKAFHLIGAEEYLKDLFNSRDILTTFEALKGMGVGQCTGVKFTHMKCDVLNMAYFDIFQEINVVTDEGKIRQNYEERENDMVLSDRLR